MFCLFRYIILISCLTVSWIDLQKQWIFLSSKMKCKCQLWNILKSTTLTNWNPSTKKSNCIQEGMILIEKFYHLNVSKRRTWWRKSIEDKKIHCFCRSIQLTVKQLIKMMYLKRQNIYLKCTIPLWKKKRMKKMCRNILLCNKPPTPTANKLMLMVSYCKEHSIIKKNVKKHYVLIYVLSDTSFSSSFFFIRELYILNIDLPSASILPIWIHCL
jgi:hypothetical protein